MVLRSTTSSGDSAWILSLSTPKRSVPPAIAEAFPLDKIAVASVRDEADICLKFLRVIFFSLNLSQSPDDFFGLDRNIINSDTDGVIDCIHDRARRTGQGPFPDSAGPVFPGALPYLKKEGTDIRHIGHGWNFVVD